MVDGISIEAAKGWGGWSLFFLMLIWWIRGIPERRRADSDAVTALHKDYGDHINRLQSENIGLRDRLANLETDYETHRKECRQETDALHAEMRKLTAQVIGLQRDIAQHSNSTAMILKSDD